MQPYEMRITRTDSTPTLTPMRKVTTRLAKVSARWNQDWRKVTEEVVDHVGPTEIVLIDGAGVNQRTEEPTQVGSGCLL